MSNYYYLAIVLPPLKIGEAPDITFTEFETLLRDNLRSDDFAKTRIIRSFYDIQNILAFWKSEKLDKYGNFDPHQLEEALLDQRTLPKYILQYLDKYENAQDRIKNFSELVHAYYRNEIEHTEGFLRTYLNFERGWRLVFVGFRAKHLGRNIAVELQHENPEDPLVLQMLAQKDAPEFEPPEGYEELKDIFEKYRNEPLALHQALCEYRFNRIEDLLGFDEFSINRILGYMIQLILVEKWIALDKNKGIAIVNNILKEAS